MRPYHHARASAARSGNDWREDLKIHEFIDSSKTAFPDLRHRMILHSTDLGGELAARAFPDRLDARELVKNHIIEDLGQVRTIHDWLSHCRTQQLPRPHPGSLPVNEEVLLEAERARQTLADHQGPRAVLEILRLPLVLAPQHGDYAWSVLCNSFGPCVVRQILGPPRELPGANGTAVIFDPAWCAEAMIFAIFRTIPELRWVVMALRSSYQQAADDPQNS